MATKKASKAAKRLYSTRHPKKALPLANRRLTQTRFLEAFLAVNTVQAAARSAKIARATHYNWLKSDPAYAARFRRPARRRPSCAACDHRDDHDLLPPTSSCVHPASGWQNDPHEL